MKNAVYATHFVITSVCLAHGNQAVSELNGKLDASYGNFNSSEGLTIEGSASLPVADMLGFQFDALHADIEDVEFSGFGAHFFWRDNQVGLLGLSAGAVLGERVDSYELSVEGEYYMDWLTLGAKAGLAAIEYDQKVPFIETDESGAFGLVYATLYPIEDLSVTLGVEQRFDNSSVRLDAEYELPINGLSLFARTMVADNDYDHVLFGLRYYFGGEKTLKQRHRHDDPRNIVQDLLFGVGTYGAEYNKRGKSYAREHGGGSGGGNYGAFDEYGSSWTAVGGDGFSVVGPEGP